CGVLNGGHACTDRVFNPPRSVCVCRHTQSEVIRLIDGGLQFFKRELLRVGIAAMCQDCPRRQHLYVVCTIMSELADFLTYFPWTVGFPVMQVPRQFDIRCQTRHCPRSASNCDVCSRDKHAWTFDVTMSYG